ncbi:NAD(P)-binding protein [Lentithecium fluviatile CBS 122367]|uniref:NAD(P)-binding protein n=1 Tax=Lentithecium fluviatile CBS 122367 TaxID=1168545 RepID=A0A6G1JM68_9PLEO|nr:NAD(P)-binding protein [Lentithecium fluviatile CBS 122367]
MSTTPVILILGAGPRIGHSVATKFASKGYEVAVVSRKGSTTITGALALTADFTTPTSIPALFSTVKDHFGAAPSVIVYNAAALTPPSDKDSVLSVASESVDKDLNVNVVSAYVTAQEAVKGWETLPKEVKKTFVYTGNIANVAILPLPMFLTLGMGKAASAYWVGTADAAYKDKGYRFFYADERHEDGKFKGMALDGDAHAEFYAQLAEHDGSVPWQATFVKGKGYVQFK